MATVTKAANAHTVVATGWTTPANAYSTTNDSAYATIATGRNATYSGDFGFPAFTTGDIPDGSTINSVTVYTTYGLSATATGALVGCQARRNSTGTTLGSEITRTAATMADANVAATGCTLADLRAANELRVRARGTKGNSSTASIARIDRLYVTVDYTAPVDNRNANVTPTGGGVLAAAATGMHTTAVASTGGGVTVAVTGAGRAASASATGAGVLDVARVAGRTSTVAATASGGASVTAEKAIPAENRNASMVATGGGVAVTSVRSARNRAAEATASGVATVAPVAARRSSPASVGGGVVAVSAATGRLVAPAASAGGRASVSIAAARRLAVAMTGGGAARLGVTGSHAAHLQAKGGGMAVVDGRGRQAAQLPGLAAAARILAAPAGAPAIAGTPSTCVVPISDAPVITSARFIP